MNDLWLPFAQRRGQPFFDHPVAAALEQCTKVPNTPSESPGRVKLAMLRWIEALAGNPADVGWYPPVIWRRAQGRKREQTNVETSAFEKVDPRVGVAALAESDEQDSRPAREGVRIERAVHRDAPRLVDGSKLSHFSGRASTSVTTRRGTVMAPADRCLRRWSRREGIPVGGRGPQRRCPRRRSRCPPCRSVPGQRRSARPSERA